MPGRFPWLPRPRGSEAAFTLVEILVSMAVLAILIVLILQLVNGTTTITGLGQAHMDTDARARALLDRMGIDIGAMVKRADVDYYLKGRPAANSQAGSGGGVNDQMAFYSEVPGYLPVGSASSATSVSLVAYRVNSNTMHLERLSKGLVWNDGSANSASATVFFLPVPLASPLPSPLPSLASPVWPQAADPSMADPDYEELGPQVFRFEYYYVLQGQGAGAPSMLSNVPWYAASPLSHTSLNGLRDVSAIGVTIAVIDQRNRTLVSNAQLATLAGMMEDAPDTLTATSTDPTPTEPDALELQWQNAVYSSGSPVPAPARRAIRIYTRCFPLNAPLP